MHNITKMNKIFVTFIGILSLMVVSCTGETVDYTEPVINTPVNSEPAELPKVSPPDVASAPLSTISHEAVEYSNEFALKFYLANSENTRGNICVSPFSVGSVLGMIANGDDGDARNEILKILGFEESEEGLIEANTYYQTLISNLPNIEEDISCFVTNTLWCDPALFLIRKPFMETLLEYYYTTKIDISPKGEDGKEAVNKFVSQNTNGLINEFLTTPLNVDLAFLNTIYFKAGWDVGFCEDRTSERTFYDINNKENKIDFMSNYSIMGYALKEDGTKAVMLNYGARKQFSMTFILPPLDVDFDSLDDVITTDNINWINGNINPELMMLTMPKFEIELNNPNTLDILKKIGLEKIVDGKASFDLISEGNKCSLQCFVHATKLKVDENGTEGAAVSLGGFDVSLGGGEEDFNYFREIVLNRPFIFYIQENTTGAILFIGSVKTFS